MKDTLISRREFLKDIGMIGAGVLLSASPWLSAFSEVVETSGEKCRLAIIGPGSRGRFLMSFLVQNPKVEIVALCDIYQPSIEKALELAPKAKVYDDYRVISQLVEEKLASSGNYLVDVVIKPGNLIIIEIDNDEGVCIDDCAELSRYVEGHLDRDVEDFELEVGSAGITSPFKVLRQYVKNIGNEVEMLLKSGTKLTGVLKSADENGVVVTVEKQVKPEGAKRKVTVREDQSYTFDEIKYTKYLIRFK